MSWCDTRTVVVGRLKQVVQVVWDAEEVAVGGPRNGRLGLDGLEVESGFWRCALDGAVAVRAVAKHRACHVRSVT